MKLFLPDTNVLIYGLAGKDLYGKYLAEWIEEKMLALSAIVVAEFLVGAHPEEEQKFEALLDKFGSLPIDTAVARIAASYRKSFLEKDCRLKLPDCLIAATAKFYGATLVTFDPKDFPMDDIKKMRL